MTDKIKLPEPFGNALSDIGAQDVWDEWAEQITEAVNSLQAQNTEKECGCHCHQVSEKFGTQYTLKPEHMNAVRKAKKEVSMKHIHVPDMTRFAFDRCKKCNKPMTIRPCKECGKYYCINCEGKK